MSIPIRIGRLVVQLMPRIPSLLPTSSRHVAIIAAGSAGFVDVKKLRREGHRVVVLERDDQVGGTWVYTPEVESDLLSLDPRRTVIHSSLYRSLRTNLPRETMGFRDYPFLPKHNKLRDPSWRFPAQGEVLMYLKDYAADFGIDELVRFETEAGGRWQVNLMLEVSMRCLMLLLFAMATTPAQHPINIWVMNI